MDDIKLFLSKIILLVYRTRELEMDSYAGFINEALDLIKTDNTEEKWMGVNKTQQLIDYIREQANGTGPINKEVFLPDVEIKLSHDNKLFKTIRAAVLRNLTEDEKKAFVISIAGEVRAYKNYRKALEISSRMSYDFKFNKQDIGNYTDYIVKVMGELEKISVSSTQEVDPSIVRFIDMEKIDDVESVYRDVNKLATDSGIYLTGWQDLNDACLGGIRPGDCTVFPALQHNYKSSFIRSVFSQILVHNDPIYREDAPRTKKPCALYLSFEDSMEQVFSYFYQYLKVCDGIQVTAKEMALIPPAEISKYVRDKFMARGWFPLFSRIDPTAFTYTSLINLILQLESDGYEIKVLLLDYLLMMNKGGCEEGPAGHSSRDLMRKTKNFTSARDIAYLTPLQLSTAAKQMLRNGVTPANFLHELEGKGFYADSSQLDQEFDLEIMVHIVPHSGRHFLSVLKAKHRGVEKVEDSKRHFYLPFTSTSGPIPDDLGKKKISVKSLPSGGGGNFGGGGSDNDSSYLSELFG